MAIQLKVDADVLKTAASEIKTQVSDLRKQWQRLTSLIQKSDSYWEGEASCIHQQYIRDLDPDMETMLKRIWEHPDDLLKMANIYIETEEELTETMKSVLQEDVIV